MLTLALVVLALLPMAERAARGFTPEGHEVIEAAAYRELLARPHVGAAGVSGTEILAYLIHHGVLARPRCFENPPDDRRCGDDARRDRPIDFWPILGTGSPDLLQSRQFGSRGQCYHFMADSSDWRGSPPDPASGVTVGMTRDAYARCVRLITSLFDEILRDPYGATLRGRGTYILLHALGDSFSRAHTDRGADGTGKIRYLKVWILRNWLVYFFEARRFDPRLHHALTDDRDQEYIDRGRSVGGKPCPGFVAPYEVPLDCLSVVGRAATDTLVDALVTLYVVLNHHGPAPASQPQQTEALPLNLDSETPAATSTPVSLDADFARAAWHGLVERHMASVYAPLVIEKQRDNEREWQPNLMIAGRVRPDLDGGGWDAAITVGGMQVVRRAMPLIPLETLSLGYGRFAGAGRFFLRADLSFLMPIWDRIGIGMAPLGVGVDCADDFSSCHGDLVTLSARVTYLSDVGIWVDLSGPEYSWVDRLWSNRVGLTVGAAFDVLHRLTPGSGRARPAAEHPPWSPPELEGKLLYRTPTALAFFIEGDVFVSDTDHLIGAGVEARRERDRDARRAGFGYGMTLAYQRGRLGDRQLDDVRVAPDLAYFLVPGTLALRVAPASLAIGRWDGDLYLDAGLSAQLSLSLSALEVSLAAPRLSYVHRDQNHATPLTLRFTWRLQD